MLQEAAWGSGGDIIYCPSNRMPYFASPPTERQDNPVGAIPAPVFRIKSPRGPVGGRAFSLRYLSAALPNLVARLFISSGAPDLGFSVVHRREKSCAKKVAQFACIDPTDAPLAKTVPGLRRYEVSTGPVTTSAGDSAYHLVAVPEFNSLQALQRGLESTEGQATAGDLTNFAQARVELLMFDIKAV